MSERPRLLLDAMLGTLARYLRMCGYDAAYALDRLAADAPDRAVSDDELLARARDEDRLLVTRDRELGHGEPRVIVLHSREVADQLRELRDLGLDLRPNEEPTRCGRCNGELTPVEPGASTPDYAPGPGTEPVWRCVECGQHFWRGSHWDDVLATLAAVRADDGDET